MYFGIDETGNRHGRLVVVKRNGKTRLGAIKWLCVCDCGNNTVVSGGHLRSGWTKSCGCLRGGKSLPKGQAAFNYIFNLAQKAAKKRGHDFQLSKEFFKKLIDSPCFYCGSPPSNIAKRPDYNGDYIYSGVDRSNSNGGYVVDNVVPCCWACNRAKSDSSASDFLAWVKKVAVYNKLIL